MSVSDKSTMTQTSIRKVAVLVESVDFPTRQALLGQMDPQVAQQVQNYAISIGTISAEERETVMREFLNSATPSQLNTTPYPEPASQNSATHQGSIHSINDHFQADQQNNVWGYGSNQDTYTQSQNVTRETRPVMDQQNGFELLQQMQEIDVALLLAAEPVEVQAVVLSKLDRTFAVDIIKLMNKQLQVDIIRRISSIDQIDDQTAQIISQNLLNKCRKQANPQQEYAQPATTAFPSNNQQDIRLHDPVNKPAAAQHYHGHDQRPVDPGLKIHNPGVPEKPTEHPSSTTDVAAISFEQLMQVKNADFDTLLKSARPELTIVALRGAERHIVKRVLSRLPNEEAKDVDRLIKDLGPVKISEIMDAQYYLIQLAMHLRDEGKMSFKLPRSSRVAA